MHGRTIRVHVERSGPHVLLRVTDSGPGMNGEQLERLFEPHFTTRSGGSGLGLAIVRELAERAGGEIAVQSELGSGTTVEHPSVACTHRGWKRHPGGGAIGLGTSPVTRISSRISSGCAGSAAAKSAWVYGCLGFLAIARASPISTIFPRYITAICWLMCATAARSCAMKR